MSENRGQFKPGQTGNPLGRPPKGTTFREMLADALAQSAGNERTKKQLLVEKIVDAALRGDKWSKEWVADRLEGKAVQPVGVFNDNPLKDLPQERLQELLGRTNGTHASGNGGASMGGGAA